MYRFAQCLGKKFSPISTFFSLVSTLAFRDAANPRFRCRDPKQLLPKISNMLVLALFRSPTFISLMEVYRFGQCLRENVLASINFLSLVSSRAFRDAPHSRFRCRDPNQCLAKFSKMVLLALPQIYTRIFHLWKTIDLHSVWVGHSRPYQLCFLS